MNSAELSCDTYTTQQVLWSQCRLYFISVHKRRNVKSYVSKVAIGFHLDTDYVLGARLAHISNVPLTPRHQTVFPVFVENWSNVTLPNFTVALPYVSFSLVSVWETPTGSLCRCYLANSAKFLDGGGWRNEAGWGSSVTQLLFEAQGGKQGGSHTAHTANKTDRLKWFCLTSSCFSSFPFSTL